MPVMSVPDSAIEEFVEHMGLITQADGGPRIAGRIFGLLLAEGRPFSLAQMADRLRISKASASTNARLLLAAGMLQLRAMPGDRQDYYELGPDPYSRMIDTITARMRHSADRVREAGAMFPGDDDGPGRRVRELAEFYESSAQFFSRWAEHRSASPGTAPGPGDQS
jgi:predicted transcriptional regulator